MLLGFKGKCKVLSSVDQIRVKRLQTAEIIGESGPRTPPRHWLMQVPSSGVDDSVDFSQATPDNCD